MMTFPTGNQTSKVSQSPVGARIAPAMSKSRSTEGLDRYGQGARNNALQHATTQTMRPTQTGVLANAPNTARNVSRVELLLAQKKEWQDACPSDAAVVSQGIYKAIKQSAHWTDVNTAILHAGKISPRDAAYAIHRLGCLNCFASRKRRADLASSGLVSSLLHTAVSGLAALDAGDLVLVLDGCARLKHEVAAPIPILESLAAAAERMAPSFGSSQLPLVLWAFSVLDFIPPISLLAALDNVLPHRVEGFTPQGVCLTLTGFQTFQYKPSQRALNLLADNLHRMLPLFTRPEVASCLEAFSSFSFQAPAHLISAILGFAGQAVNSDQSSGKMALSPPPYVQFSAPNLANGHVANNVASLPNGKASANGKATGYQAARV